MTTHAAAKPKLERPAVMITVESTNVAALGHNRHGLFVRFKDGTEGVYRGVEESVFHRALGADSVGGFLHSTVKPGYTWEKLS